MANTRTYVHTEITKVDSNGNEIITFPRTTISDVTTSAKSEINIEGKVLFSAICSTAANAVAKTVNIPGFSLITGAHLTVKFTNGITVADATLSVNNSIAIPIMFKGVKLLASTILANNSVILEYDGVVFNVVSGAGGSRVSKNESTKFFVLGVPTEVNGTPVDEYYDTGVFVTPTSGELDAKKFKGDGSQLTNLNATSITSGTLSANRLANSGAVADAYGPDSDATLNFSNVIKIPRITVDEKGRVTSISDINLKLPPNPDTDVKVTSTLNTTTKFYLTGSSSSGTETGTLIKDSGVYVDSTAGKLVATSMQSGIFYLGGTNSYINSTTYTGQAATVSTITAHLIDNCSSNGTTTKALTANQGYVLMAKISSLESGKLNVTANAVSATILQTPRSINGTSFNGSSDITTANWGTARNLTIGNITKSVNGSGNVSWSLSEIGAAATTHSHDQYLTTTSLGTQVTYSFSNGNLYITTK